MFLDFYQVQIYSILDKGITFDVYFLYMAYIIGKGHAFPMVKRFFSLKTKING